MVGRGGAGRGDAVGRLGIFGAEVLGLIGGFGPEELDGRVGTLGREGRDGGGGPPDIEEGTDGFGGLYEEEEKSASSVSTGGGRGVWTVLVDTSDISVRASLQVWYIRIISSLLEAAC